MTSICETYEETLIRLGREEGEKIGREQGREQEKRKDEKEKEEIAKKLFEMGYSVEKVKKVTNLSQEKIMLIQNTVIK